MTAENGGMDKPGDRLLTRLVAEGALPALDYTVRPLDDGGIRIDSKVEDAPIALSNYGVLDLLGAEHIAFARDGDVVMLDAR